MMQEEGLAVPGGAVSANPASGGDKHAVNPSLERNTNYRTTYNNQSGSEGRELTGSNRRQSRLPPKRKDLESKSLNLVSSLFLFYTFRDQIERNFLGSKSVVCSLRYFDL